MKPLSQNQRIRVLVHGIGVYCYVKDVASREIFWVIDAINSERAAGRPCIGVMLGHVQVDLMGE